MVRAAHLSFRPPRPGEEPPSARKKGRGATSNASGRYESQRTEGTPFDDNAPVNDDAFRLKTDVTVERARKIITYNTSPFVGFDRSINPYRGCEHGCIYCFARPTHAYMGLSPGLDFESKLFAKPSAPALLTRELSNTKYVPRPIAMGTNTDPYQPIERKFRLMRGIISTLARFSHPFTILTKSHLITRDIDLLAPLAAKNLTRVMISITTEDKALARHMEPRASSPERRFDAVAQLAQAGVPVGVMTAPMIPGLNDDELESLLERSKEAGAEFVGYTIIRLPLEVSTLFQEWLQIYGPDRAGKVMRLIREMNGGKDYDVEWSRGREIKAPYAKLIAHRFHRAARSLGLDKKPDALDLSQFKRPSDPEKQPGLFDDAVD
ncbi:MAG: PA0069 family radical SAM protein [Pseudomonadota bacterium]